LKGEEAQAAATVVVILASLGIVGVGAPIYVDSNADRMPDDTLYEAEKFGESIKEVAVNAGLYGNKADWQMDRWEERTKEFENVAAENKAARYMGVLKRAQERMERACELVENLRGLDRAENVTKWHIEVLRRVKKKVPENARWGINNAIRNAKRYREGLEEARKAVKRRRGPPEEIIENKMKKVRKIPIRRPGRGR